MSLLPTDHPKVPSPKLGVLLINLGTPDALDYWSMRRYLGEFLSDKRVVELPKILWQLILQGADPHVSTEEIGGGISANLE